MTLTKTMPNVQCTDCGGSIELTVWGEGIDVDWECTDCDTRGGFR